MSSVYSMPAALQVAASSSLILRDASLMSVSPLQKVLKPSPVPGPVTVKLKPAFDALTNSATAVEMGSTVDEPETLIVPVTARGRRVGPARRRCGRGRGARGRTRSSGRAAVRARAEARWSRATRAHRLLPLIARILPVSVSSLMKQKDTKGLVTVLQKIEPTLSKDVQFTYIQQEQDYTKIIGS